MGCRRVDRPRRDVQEEEVGSHSPVVAAVAWSWQKDVESSKGFDMFVGWRGR